MMRLVILAAPAAKPLLPSAERLAEIGIRLAILLVVAFVVVRLLYRLVGRLEEFIAHARAGGAAAQQRARTIAGVLRRLCFGLVVGVCLFEGLAILGWDVKPLLAGAGLLGLAIGLGAQSLVKDMIAGISILGENRFGVGDVVEIEGKTATVEQVTLRTTTLRDSNGYLLFFSNGEIRTVANRSRDWNSTLVDVPVAADEDGERALAVLGEEVRRFNEEPAWQARLLDPAAVQGIESLSATALRVRVGARTRPGIDAVDVARELRRRLHAALFRAGIRTGVRRSNEHPSEVQPT